MIRILVRTFTEHYNMTNLRSFGTQILNHAYFNYVNVTLQIFNFSSIINWSFEAAKTKQLVCDVRMYHAHHSIHSTNTYQTYK